MNLFGAIVDLIKIYFYKKLIFLINYKYCNINLIMEPKGKFLCNQYIRLGNPILAHPSEHNYIGNDVLPTIEWKRQKKNIDKFLEQISHFDIVPTMIHSAKWNPLNIAEQPTRFSFILETSDPNLIWQRTDQNGVGLSYNWIYYKKNKINLMIFNAYTLEELTTFLER